jgi:hypothetical protein
VLGAFDAVTVPAGAGFPYALQRMCVFAQFAGGRGTFAFRVAVVDASTGDEVFGSPPHAVNLPGGHAIVTTLFRLVDCPFPSPGTYVVQLFCSGVFVDDRRLTVA